MWERIDDAGQTTKSAAGEHMAVLLQMKDAVDAQERVTTFLGEKFNTTETTTGNQMTILGQLKHIVAVQKRVTKSLVDRM